MTVHKQQRALSPYDTGERAQPQVWVTPDQRRPAEDNRDSYGRVDFDDADGTTLCTIWVEGTDGGTSIIHIENHGMSGIERIVFDPNGEDTSPVFTVSHDGAGEKE